MHTQRHFPAGARDVRGEVMALLDQMRVAADNPARVRMLTDQIEMFAFAHIVPAAQPHYGVPRITRREARIMSALIAAHGGIVSKDAMMNALYFDRAGEEPEPKIIDVLMCKLRSKLKSTRYSIETVHSWGHRLRVAQGNEKPASDELAGSQVRDFMRV